VHIRKIIADPLRGVNAEQPLTAAIDDWLRAVRRTIRCTGGAAGNLVGV